MNPLAMDPSRTLTLRNNFSARMRGKFNRLKQSITSFVVETDAFGLQPRRLLLNVRDFQFLTDPEKVQAFRRWLQQQIRGGILVATANQGQPWMNEFLENAYRKGVVRAYMESRQIGGKSIDFQAGSKAQFLESMFTGPESVRTLEMLYTRAFTQLEGITDKMDAQISTALADSFVRGYGAEKTARMLVREVDTFGSERAMLLARSEIIRAHAEAQLDAFERLGVEEIGLLAEVLTAGDNRVCPICKKLADDGPYTIQQCRGMLPAHARCRCAFKGIIDKSRKRGRAA